MPTNDGSEKEDNRSSSTKRSTKKKNASAAADASAKNSKSRAKKNTNKSDGKKSAADTAKKTASDSAASVKKESKASSRKVPSANKSGSKKATAPAQKSRQKKIQSDSVLQIISLGGLEEIGKNMTLFVCDEDAIIVDCGMAFPDDELLGVDTVIPDFTYLESIRGKLRGLVVTHGHEDHIGGIPFLLQQFHLPIYATPLTAGLIVSKLREYNLMSEADLNTVHTGDTVELGCFSVEFIRVNHSIPDAAALAITTPAGVIVHSGDFKIDYTPVFEETADLGRLSEYGEKGVLALLCDSTNAERPGNSISESHVGSSFESLFSRAEGKRVIIATFSSNIQRVQQIIDFAENHGRKIAFSGRSMLNNVQIAQDLGYITCKENTIVDIETIKSYRPEDMVIITTGSQGEPMSALSRMASGEHRQIKITSKDFIIISATPIPGNEKTVTRVINSLLKLGSDVIYESMYEVHASGHACQNEIKLLISLVKPKYFFPVHGEYRHLVKNRATAISMGIPERNVIISEIGKVVEFDHGKFSFNGTVESGHVLVDGYGVGDVGTAVLRDRRHLSSDGLVVVVCTIDSGSGNVISGPDIISRGFVYVKESEDLITEARERTQQLLESLRSSGRLKRGEMQDAIRAELGKLMYQKTKKSPMIIPVIMDI
ncbi:MAG: RNase J family beta-CASP ribonuclease [Oscillospiraceae bacterium]|nr:RNase J family beta-CASP ribonuclease [Oscillospiraceae bacterium]